MTPSREDQMETIHLLGLEVLGKTYEESVEMLIHAFIAVQEQIELDNRDFLKQEIERVLKPNN